jgi:DNA-binding transcriptional regulator YdaS (Cro superfamily)
MKFPFGQNDIAATGIYQRNLDAVSEALWSGDLELMLEHIALPNQMLTDDAEFVIASPDEMLLVMQDFRAALVGMGADSYVRLCRGAAFVTGRADMITGLHDTYILRDGRALRPPYLNQMTLIRTRSGTWQGMRIEARTRNADCQIISPDLALAQRLELQRAFQSRTQTDFTSEAPPDARD